MAWMVVRVRGTIHARNDIARTLHHLHLTRPNHATVIPENPEMRGMLIKVQGYVTWGEADAATLGALLEARGQSPTGARLSGGPAIPELAKSVADRGLPATEGLRPLFRLKAPKGGWKSTKKPFARGGALGYRGRTINDLVRRML